MRPVHVAVMAVLVTAAGAWATAQSETSPSPESHVSLPAPRLDGSVSVEAAIAARRTVREFADAPVPIEAVSQLLWAAQGITDPARGRRAAPSAGALYPLELFVLSGAVAGLAPGVYRYQPAGHRLSLVRSGDVRPELATGAGCQPWLGRAPVVLVIAARVPRTTAKYGERGVRYVHMEVGHAAENVALQALALGLASGVAGSFTDEGLRRVVGGEEGVTPLYVVAVGRRK